MSHTAITFTELLSDLDSSGSAGQLAETKVRSDCYRRSGGAHGESASKRNAPWRAVASFLIRCLWGKTAAATLVRFVVDIASLKRPFHRNAFPRQTSACMTILLCKLKEGRWLWEASIISLSLLSIPLYVALPLWICVCVLTNTECRRFGWKDTLLDTKLLAVLPTQILVLSPTLSHSDATDLFVWGKRIFRSNWWELGGEGLTTFNLPSIHFLVNLFQKEEQHPNIRSAPRCSCLYLWDRQLF